jgi:hypothetical protein
MLSLYLHNVVLKSKWTLVKLNMWGYMKNSTFIIAALLAIVSTSHAIEKYNVDGTSAPISPQVQSQSGIDELTYSILKVSIVSGNAEKARLAQVSSQNSQDTITTSQSALQTTTSISTTTIENKESTSDTPTFSGAADFSLTTDFNQDSNSEKAYGTGLVANLKYQINSEYKATLRLDVEKDLSDSYEEKINDTKVTFSKKAITLVEDVKLAPSTSLVLPTSESSKRNKDMNFAVEVNPALVYQLNSATSITYLPRFRANSYEYTTSRTKKVLDQYKITQFFVIDYSITDKLLFEPALILSNKWSHTGRRQDPSYLTQLELAYTFTDEFEVAVGTLTGGSLYDRENGPDKEIEVFDKNSTEFYTTFGLKF